MHRSTLDISIFVSNMSSGDAGVQGWSIMHLSASCISIFDAILPHSTAILPEFNGTNPDRVGFTGNQEDDVNL